MAIYYLANLAYFYALPVEEVVTSNSTQHRAALPVASKAAGTFLGEYGGKLVVNTSIEKRVESVTGLVLILAGLPLFFWFRSTARPAQE